MKRILFFGSDQFSVSCYQSLVQNLNSGVIVDTVAVANSHMARAFHDSGMIEVKEMRDLNIPDRYDFGLVASFGKFIPPRILNHFSFALNVHPSLLPKYRGPSPIQQALINDDGVTGVSIIDVHPTLIDGGHIYAQQELKIHPNDNFISLNHKLSHAGGELLADVVNHMHKFTKSAQDLDKVSLTRKLSKDDGKLNFDEMTSNHIRQLFKAIGHQIHLFIKFRGFIIVFNDIRAFSHPLNYDSERRWSEFTSSLTPGALFLEKPTKALWVKTKSGWISCNSFHMSSSPIRYNGSQILSALHLKNFDTIK